jgi:3-carboxy-cis,cis-muconate cycloisomerase
MAASLFSSALFGPLVSDTEIAALFDDSERLRRMLQVEAALAKVEGRLGVIPAEAGIRIAAAAASLHPDPAALAERTARDGVAVPALVAALRLAVAKADRSYVHWGATSQDVVDTAFVLTVKDALVHLERRLVDLVRALGRMADRHRRTIMPGRTRFQPAVPISFGAKVAGWMAPILRDLDRLAELDPRLCVLSFGGAAGTLSALGERAGSVEAALAAELGLGLPAAPWHAARDCMAELGAWLALVSGTLGKVGQDLVLLSQFEIAEIKLGESGGSSTMAHKQNPVGPELLVALARFNADRVGSLFNAMIHANERDGAAWTLEWLTLPEMAVATGAATRIATEIVAGLTVDEAAMRAHVTGAPGLLLSEAAVFALAEHMSRAEAESLVKDAAGQAVKSGDHLIDILSRLSDAPVDWSRLRDPAGEIATAELFIDRVLSRLPK